MKELLKLRSESLDDALRVIFLEFDQYCEANGIRYSIECDEHNEQSYLVKHDHKTDGLIEKMTDEVRDSKAVMNIDRNRRDGVLFHFTVKPIVDGNEAGAATMMDDRFRNKLDQRLSEEVIGLGAPEVLITVAHSGSLSKEEPKVNSTETIQYSIQGSPDDLKIVDEILHAINDGKSVGGACFSGPVRVMKIDNGGIEDTNNPPISDPVSPLDELGEKLMRVLAMGA